MLTGCAGILQTGSLKDAYKNYNEENYEEAFNKIRLVENISEMTDELQAELTYLKARTYEQMGEKNEANALYQYLKDQHSVSQYGYLAAKNLAKIETNSP